MADAFDVWLLKANTVYKKVPYGVATGWAEQGRLSADDKVRPAGVQTQWVRVGDHPLLSDFLFAVPPGGGPADVAEQLHDVEMDVNWGKTAAEEDDDVDMIPLIDISMVLLIFFMMTATVAAVSSVDVPVMRNASEIGKDPNAFTVSIDRRKDGNVVYSLRVGDNLPDNEDNNLASKDDVTRHLKAKLKKAKEAPEVRIACHKELPRALVHEVAKELHKLRDEKLIAFYGAEVVEQK
jgi:biopolymer transport protein ExbD